MTLPALLLGVLPADTAKTWETLAELLPSALYLAGGTALAAHLHHRQSRDLDFFYHEAAVDLDALAASIAERGPFAVQLRAPGTWNGVFSGTKLQFLHADEQRQQRRLEPTTSLAGIEVAGIGDIFAMKLKVIAERGELRDYFDVKTIEERTHRTVEEGLELFAARYALDESSGAIGAVIRALGYLGDVDEDSLVPESKDEIAAYWAQRQPEIVRRLTRFS
jgi:hypothetical protein